MLAQLLKTLLLPPLPVMPFALALAFRSAAKPAPALRARERTAAAARMVFFTTFAFHVAIKTIARIAPDKPDVLRHTACGGDETGAYEDALAPSVGLAGGRHDDDIQAN